MTLTAWCGKTYRKIGTRTCQSEWKVLPCEASPTLKKYPCKLTEQLRDRDQTLPHQVLKKMRTPLCPLAKCVGCQADTSGTKYASKSKEFPYKCWRDRVAKKWKEASCELRGAARCQERLDGTCDDPW